MRTERDPLEPLLAHAHLEQDLRKRSSGMRTKRGGFAVSVRSITPWTPVSLARRLLMHPGMKKPTIKNQKLQLATTTIRTLRRPTERELMGVHGGSGGKPTDPHGGDGMLGG